MLLLMEIIFDEFYICTVVFKFQIEDQINRNSHETGSGPLTRKREKIKTIFLVYSCYICLLFSPLILD